MSPINNEHSVNSDDETLGPDPLRIGELVRPDIERAVHEKYGEETEVSFAVAQVADVRLYGTFPEKAPLIRGWVQGLLSEALESLDAVEA